MTLVASAMAFAPFVELFPAIAAAETRSITLLRAGTVPAGTYGFLEAFCDDEGCDCRRVFLNVCGGDNTPPALRQAHLATISFGWESKAFYRLWASFALPEDDLAELRGPALVRLARQSDYAPALLDHFKVVLEDKAYVARIVRHYKMFRAAVDQKNLKSALKPHRSQPKAGRNKPCPCGSGVKYKKCCWERPGSV